MEEDVKILEIQATGSFVKKLDLRKALNIRTDNHWYQEIALLCKIEEDFEKEYQPYKTHRYIPIRIAKRICNTIFENSGEEMTIQFVYPNTVSSPITPQEAKKAN